MNSPSAEDAAETLAELLGKRPPREILAAIIFSVDGEHLKRELAKIPKSDRTNRQAVVDHYLLASLDLADRLVAISQAHPPKR